MNQQIASDQSSPTRAWMACTPRDLVEAVSAQARTGGRFLTVALRGASPWLVPDTTVTRGALVAVGIPVRKLESLPAGDATGDAIPDLSRWAQMAVALQDDDGIGWLVIVMKAGSVMRIADNARNRLFVLHRQLPLVEARVSADGVTRIPLPNG